MYIFQLSHFHPKENKEEKAEENGEKTMEIEITKLRKRIGKTEEKSGEVECRRLKY